MSITLIHRQLVRLAPWSCQYARVFTQEGFDKEQAEKGWAPIEGREPCQPSAWQSGVALSSSPEHYRHEKELFDSAQVVTPGETYMIEGKPYVCQVIKGSEREPKCSDPIHFIPA
jgi:hypothetical protein